MKINFNKPSTYIIGYFAIGLLYALFANDVYLSFGFVQDVLIWPWMLLQQILITTRYG